MAKKPIVLTIFSTFGGIFFLVIFSIIRNKILPPSKAGNGIRLRAPTFIDRYAVKYMMLSRPALACCPTREYIPTGPDKSFTLARPVNKYFNVSIIVPNNDSVLLIA